MKRRSPGGADGRVGNLFWQTEVNNSPHPFFFFFFTNPHEMWSIKRQNDKKKINNK